MRPLIFTGCGRSGTGYVSQVLSAAGVACQHEGVFQGRVAFRDQGKLRTGVAESSWFAAPFLGKYADRSPLVVHLVRDPRTWIDSWLRSEVTRYPTVRAYLRRWCPGAAPRESRGAVDAAMHFWWAWNLKVQKRADLRVRIEDLGQRDLELILRVSGRDTPSAVVAEALQAVPRNYNHKGGTPSRLEWEDLPAGASLSLLRSKAKEYGYL